MATADKYYTGPRSTLLRPSAAHFQRLLETAELPTLAIKRAYAYRILEWQSPPDRHVPMECHFCGIVWRDCAVMSEDVAHQLSPASNTCELHFSATVRGSRGYACGCTAGCVHRQAAANTAAHGMACITTPMRPRVS